MNAFSTVVFLAAFVVAFVLIPLSPTPARAAHSDLECQGYLLGISVEVDQRIFRQTIHERFAHGLEKDEDIAAYTGISHDMMKELLQNGKIELPPDGFRMELIPTNEHPAGKVMINSSGKSEPGDVWDRFNMISIASYTAQTLSSFSTVLKNINKTLSTLDVQTGRWILSVINELDFPDYNRKQPYYHPSYQELRAAILDSDVPYPDTKFGEDDDVDEIITNLKMIELGRRLGISTASKDLINRAWQLKIEKVFKGMPIETGYVLGLRPQALVGQTDPHNSNTLTIRLQDVAGIEPQSDQEYNFLDELGDD